MKTSLRYAIAATLVAVLATLIFAWFALGPKTFEVQGRVAGLQDDGNTLVVEHEEVPGYMPAMVMPLSVADPRMTASLEEGESIQFEMTVSQDSTWISAIESIPDTAVARHPARKTQPMPGMGADPERRLDRGDEVPGDLTLTNQAGEPIQLADFRGQGLVLTFIYTRCPLPDYCPLMSKRLATLQPKLREKFGEEVQLLSISFDVEYDTPAVLRDYASRYTDQLDTWTFATGDSAQVAEVTSRFGVFTKENDQEITHNLVTAIVDRDGTLQRLYRGNEWTPEEVMQVLSQMLEARKSA